jgi:preprotein translocase subunit SecY
MDNKVDYLVFESTITHLNMINKRLWILCLILIILLFGTNVYWVCYESQFQDETTTIEATQDGSGTNIVGGGNINYGAESTDHEN